MHYQNHWTFNLWFYVFARMFNPDRFFLTVLLFYVTEGDIFALKYLLGIVITAISVQLFKRLTDRERPDGEHCLGQI